MKRDEGLVLGPADGEHVRLAIWGRAHPGGLSVTDGNWLCADIAVLAASGFRCRAFLRTKDFESFHCGVVELLADDATSARLLPRDPWLVAEVHRTEQGWSAEITARDHGSVRVAELSWTPSREELERLAVDLERLVREYPVQR